MGEPAPKKPPGTASAEAVSPRLVSLAILKANWNQGRSYLDNFVPFVAECLRITGEPVTPADMQKALRRRFGMAIPQHTVQTILARAAEQHLVYRRDGLFHPRADRLGEKVLGPMQGELLRCNDALVGQLITFADGRYHRTWSAGEAQAALDEYVSERGAPAVLRGCAADVEFEPRVVTEEGSDFIVHAFVENLVQADPASFSYFQTVVEGSMLASVVYLPDVGTVQRKFGRNSTVYLDTPFLLRRMGYLGEELEAPAIELTDLLLAYGARLACFDRTVSEVKGVLSAAAGGWGRSGSRSSDVSQYLRSRGLRRADIELQVAELPDMLKRLKITVLSTPGYSEALLVDEKSFEDVLRARVRYSFDGTLFHDLHALVAIYRLRHGRAQPILEASSAIFLTTNARLVKASREFFRDDGDRFSWPLAILDSDLATLVWLKQPMKAPELPRKQILADCYAALHPEPPLWNRWLNEIEKTAASGTFSDAQLDIMRFSPDAQRALMDRTLGNPKAIDERTLREVLRDAEARISAPALAALEEERFRREEAEAETGRERAAREAVEQVMADNRAQDQGEIETGHANATREAVKQALADDRARRHGVLQRIAHARARGLCRVLFAVMLLVFAGGVFTALMGVAVVPGPHLSLWLRVPALVVAVVVAVVTVAGAGWGFNLRDFSRKVERRLGPWLHRRAIRRLGEEL